MRGANEMLEFIKACDVFLFIFLVLHSVFTYIDRLNGKDTLSPKLMVVSISTFALWLATVYLIPLVLPARDEGAVKPAPVVAPVQDSTVVDTIR